MVDDLVKLSIFKEKQSVSQSEEQEVSRSTSPQREDGNQLPQPH